MLGVIIYKGKYGATQQYATWIARALNIDMYEAGAESPEDLADADYVVIGTSIYIGKYQIRDWLEEHQQELVNKEVFIFSVSGTPPAERDKLEGYYRENVPPALWNARQRAFLPGRLVYHRLSWKDKLLLNGGAFFARLRGEIISKRDYNDVTREHVLPFISMIRDITGHSLPLIIPQSNKQ